MLNSILSVDHGENGCYKKTLGCYRDDTVGIPQIMDFHIKHLLIMLYLCRYCRWSSRRSSRWLNAKWSWKGLRLAPTWPLYYEEVNACFRDCFGALSGVLNAYDSKFAQCAFPPEISDDPTSDKRSVRFILAWHLRLYEFRTVLELGKTDFITSIESFEVIRCIMTRHRRY